MMNQLIADTDRENYEKIVRALNRKQCNTFVPWKASGPQRSVWNLSDFGFALEVTRAVPSRYLRIRCLKRLLEITSNPTVASQIETYLLDDKKHDSQIADNLSFELERLNHSSGLPAAKIA
jgi:hypothetical protein